MKKYITLIHGIHVYPLLTPEQLGMIVGTFKVGTVEATFEIVELTDQQYLAEKNKFENVES